MGRKKKVLQFVSIPDNVCSTWKYTPMDLYIYAGIKSYANQRTRLAFPSLVTLAKRLKCSVNSIRDSIYRMNGDLFVIHRRKNTKGHGVRNIYQFPQLHRYEDINVELLWRKDLSIQEKAYILACHQYMFKDKKNVGKICYSSKDLAKLLNLNTPTMRRYERLLIGKKLLKKIESSKYTGLAEKFTETQRLFDLKALGQEFIWKRKAEKRKEERKEERKKKRVGKKLSLSQLQEKSVEATGLNSSILEAIRIGYEKIINDRNV